MKKHAIRTRLADERGATVVIVAVSIAMLIGCAALAVDLGMLLNSRGEAQRVADAAALAGASVFLDDAVPENRLVEEATARAHAYGENNTVSGEPVFPNEMQVEVLTAERKVRVTITRRDIPLWFAQIFGRRTADVAARAAAVADLSGSVECMRPIAFADLWHERTGDALRYTIQTPSGPPCPWNSTNCDYYENIETGRGHWWRNATSPVPGKGLYEAPDKKDDVGRQWTFDLNTTTVDPAAPERLHRYSYYPLRIPGCTGGSCWRQGLSGAICTGRISIEDDIITEPGIQVGPTDQGFTAARNADPDARWDDARNRIVGSRYPLGCEGDACNGDGSPRVFIVAMIDPVSAVSSNASRTFKVQNFGAFFLESWVASGGTNRFTVRWMKPRPVRDNCNQNGTCRSNLQLPLRLVE